MSWEGSRKRRRSPPPGYEDEFKPLIFKEVELPLPPEPEPEPKAEEVKEEETTNVDGGAAAPTDVAEESAPEEKTEGEPVGEEAATAAATTEEKMDAEDKSAGTAEAAEKAEPEAAEEQKETAEAMDESASASAEAKDSNDKPSGEDKAKSTGEAPGSQKEPEKKRPKKPATAQFYFNRQHTSSVVCRLTEDDHEQVRVMMASRHVGSEFLRCLFDESQVLLNRCKELQEQLRLDEKYDCSDFQVELITGRRQASRASHHHVTLPVHAYYLLRLYYFKELCLQNDLSSTVRNHLPAEHWGRFSDGRRRFLDDQSTRAKHYHREDEDLVQRNVRNFDRAQDSLRKKAAAEAKEQAEKAKAEQKAKEEEAKAVAKAAAEAAEKEKEAAEKEAVDSEADADTKEEDAAAKTNGEEKMEEAAAETAVKEEEAAESTEDTKKAEEEKTEADQEENTSTKEEADESAKESEMETAESVPVPDLEPEDIVYTEDKGNKIAKANYRLGEPTTSQVCGLELEATFDPDQEGLPVVVVDVKDFPVMRDATPEQFEKLLDALSAWSDCLHFGSVCTYVLRPGSSRIRIVTDIGSFLYRLDLCSVPVWAKLWKESRSSKLSTSSRAMHESVQQLESREPAAIHLSEWSEY